MKFAFGIFLIGIIIPVVFAASVLAMKDVFVFAMKIAGVSGLTFPEEKGQSFNKIEVVQTIAALLVCLFVLGAIEVPIENFEWYSAIIYLLVFYWPAPQLLKKRTEPPNHPLKRDEETAGVYLLPTKN